MKRVLIVFPDDIKEQLVAIATARGVSVSSIVRAAVVHFLDNQAVLLALPEEQRKNRPLLVVMDASLRRRLMEYVERTDVPMARVVRRALQQALDDPCFDVQYSEQLQSRHALRLMVTDVMHRALRMAARQRGVSMSVFTRAALAKYLDQAQAE